MKTELIKGLLLCFYLMVSISIAQSASDSLDLKLKVQQKDVEIASERKTISNNEISTEPTSSASTDTTWTTPIEETTLPIAQSEIDSPIRFHVVVKPTVLQVQYGEQVKLTCMIYGGNSSTIVLWTQDKPKRRYASTKKNDKKITSSHLTLTSYITLDDSSKIGQYTCVALDVDGNIHSAILTMQNNDKDICQPNEISCTNPMQGRKCVEKYWMCDGDRDCDDGSDEEQRYCDLLPRQNSCKPSEFQCTTTNRTPICIRRSLQCDGYHDCPDHSDEIGCLKPTIIQTSKYQIQINTSDTLILRCTARGIPTPYINWRLNWRHICGDGSDNQRCTIEQSRDTNDSSIVTGILTIRNINRNDSGIYACEAQNRQGSIFALPDIVVTVIGLS